MYTKVRNYDVAIGVILHLWCCNRHNFVYYDVTIVVISQLWCCNRRKFVSTMPGHRNYAKFCKKKSQNSRNQGFSNYFCLMFKGSRSGSIPLTNGSRSGSRRPKNVWIRWFQIRNTAVKTTPPIMYTLNFWGHKYSRKFLITHFAIS